jgi:eukaryotic-like serine/threonine-protein kinase
VAETGSVPVQAAEALHAAHRGGIIHCDVKPANLLVASDGTVTMVDFGVARSAAATTTTAATAVLGTALYMAPEQVSGHPVSPTTDIYALGAVAYHCLGRRAPFTGESLLEIALRHLSDEPPPLPSDVPPALRIVITRAMSKDPARRYPATTDLADAVRRALAGRSATGSTVRDLPVVRDPPARPRRPRRAVAAAVSVVASAVASAVAALLLAAGALVVVLGPASPTTGPSAQPTPPASTATPSTVQRDPGAP